MASLSGFDSLHLPCHEFVETEVVLSYMIPDMKYYELIQVKLGSVSQVLHRI
jgi:hypothetical protein